MPKLKSLMRTKKGFIQRSSFKVTIKISEMKKKPVILRQRSRFPLYPNLNKEYRIENLVNGKNNSICK